MQPTFFFARTKKGIITSTYPLVRKLSSPHSEYFEILHYGSAVQCGVWYPKVEFIFILATGDAGFKQNQLLPITFEQPKKILKLPASGSLKDAPIYWGKMMDTEFAFELADAIGEFFLSAEYNEYRDWHEKIGRGMLSSLWDNYEMQLERIHRNDHHDPDSPPDDSWNNAFDDYDQYREWLEN